jgi:hypothetical protein
MTMAKKLAAEEKSPTLALLEESGAAPTRDNFLDLASLGNPQQLEAELPAPFQEKIRDNDRRLFESSQKKNFIAMKSPYAKQ